MKMNINILSLILSFTFLGMANAADIYKVTNIGQGKSLKLKQSPSRTSKTLVALPHDASWILRRDKGRKVVDKVVWRKVQWNNALGWVSAHYLVDDPQASKLAIKRKACLKDRKIKEKICCGYTRQARQQAYKHVPILMVRNIPIGGSLILHSQATEFSSKLVAIPHDATWLADLGKKKRHSSGIDWSYIRWSGKRGWVKTRFIKSDPQTTHIGDLKRKLCTSIL